MRVLHVIPSVGPRRGGPSAVLRAMVGGLAQTGIQTEVLCTNDNGDDLLDVKCDEPVLDNGVTYRFFPRQTNFYTVSLPLARWLAQHVCDYDLLHVHSLFTFPTSAAAFWAQMKHRPYILRPLGSLCQWGIKQRRPTLKRISLAVVERRIIAGAAALHYATLHEKKEAELLTSGSRQLVVPDVVVIPNALSECSPTINSSYTGEVLTKRHDTLWITSICRFDRVKGLELLLRATARVKTSTNKEFKIVLVGDGDSGLVRELKSQAADLGLGTDIIWTGYLSRPETFAVLHHTDIFVQPSLFESFGIALVEAMQCGVPVVVSTNVGLHSEIAAAEAGIISKYTAESFADSIVALLDRPSMRERMGSNGRALADQFTEMRIIPQLVNLYSSVLAGTLAERVCAAATIQQ